MLVSYGDFGVSASDVMAEADKLDADMLRVNASISDSGDSTFQAGWGAFYAKWRAYYQSLTGVTGWLSRAWSSDQAVNVTLPQYRNQLVSWEQDFKMRGGDVVGGVTQEAPAQVTVTKVLTWMVAGWAVIHFAPKVFPHVKKWAPILYAKVRKKG